MEILKALLDFILHLDNHLFDMIVAYGFWVYAILFLIIFVETGLVVMPLLPGDSLLFAAGAFCAGVQNDAGQTAELNLFVILSSLIVAAILGDALNYLIGRTLGEKMVNWKIKGKQIINPKYLEKTNGFYELHGPKTIIIARFVPIVRTFAPFVAGIGAMSYRKFIRYNIVGGVVWVISLVFLGYFFGNMDFVKKNFETVIFGIIGLSLLPMVFEIVKNKLKKRF